MEGLNFISLNVRGMRDRSKRETILGWAKMRKGDVVMLQETYSTYDIEEKWRKEWGGQVFYSHGSNHSKGVLILLKPGLNFKLDQVVKDDDGRFVLLKGDLLGYKLLLGNVYFPTREKVQQQIWTSVFQTCIITKLLTCFRGRF